MWSVQAKKSSPTCQNRWRHTNRLFENYSPVPRRGWRSLIGQKEKSCAVSSPKDLKKGVKVQIDQFEVGKDGLISEGIWLNHEQN